MPPRPNQAKPNADEADYAAFAKGTNVLDIEAATWALRKKNGLSAAQQSELDAWLAKDPSHAEALQGMEVTLGHVQQMPDDDVAALKAGLPEQTPTIVPGPGSTISPWVRAWTAIQQFFAPRGLGFAMSMALLVFGGVWQGWSYWWSQPIFEQSYATHRGGQQTVQLADASDQAPNMGSTLQLDTQTQLTVRLYRHQREVHLHSGQALFKVHGDVKRPFVVVANGVRVQVVGTTFSVRHTDSGLHAGQVYVQVQEGQVRVQAQAQKHVLLHAGQAVLTQEQGSLSSVDPVQPSQVGDWRSGSIRFDDASLATVLQEFERYARINVVVRDPQVAALRLGGTYRVEQLQQFVDSLPKILPVRLQQNGAMVEIVPL